MRLFLNVAYKRVEPTFRFLGHPIPGGWLRFLFNWYARPFLPRDEIVAVRPAPRTIGESRSKEGVST